MTLRMTSDMSKEELFEIAAGKDKVLLRSMAINELASYGSPDTVGLLRKVLMTDSETPKIRRLAAIALWRTNSSEATYIFSKAAETIEDTTVLTALLKCLGRIGDEGALKVILKIREIARGALASQASFAASLISYRLGLEGNDLPFLNKYFEIPLSSRLGLKYTVPTSSEADIFMSCMAHEPYGIKLSKESALQCSGLGCTWMVAINHEMTRGSTINLLQNRKNLLAIVASKSSEDNRYSASYLVLTSPAEESKVNILINRITGEPAWAGTTIDPINNQARFSVRTVGSVGIVPMELECIVYANGKIDILTAAISTIVSERRVPNLLEIAPV